MIQCYNDKDNVGIDEAARPQRQRTGVSAAPLLGETLMIHMRRKSVLSGFSHWIRYIATPHTPHTDQECLRPQTGAGPRPRRRPRASLHTQCNHSLPPSSRHQRLHSRSEWPKQKRTAPSVLRRGPKHIRMIEGRLSNEKM